MVGVNKGSSDNAKAIINGKINNPFVRPDNQGVIALILIFLLILFGIAIGILLFTKQN
jgi:hypothetical protein